MKQSRDIARTFSSTGLFMVLFLVKTPFIILAAFTLLFCQGIKMYIAFISEDPELKDENGNRIQERKNGANKAFLILIDFIFLLIPIFHIGMCFYLLNWRREIWLPFFK